MVVLGIVNATPDSFSDGGENSSPLAAGARARSLVAGGAGMIDIGAESTRPGAAEVSADEEAGRLFPVLEAVLAAVDAPVSIDTRRASIARRALAMGAKAVNDVSALSDPGMAMVVAEAGATLFLMHGYREHLAAPHIDPNRLEVRAGQVAEFLAQRIDAAVAAGVPRGRIVADPGLGFGKSHRESLRLLACAAELKGALGVDVLIAPSRKRFLRHYFPNASTRAELDAVSAAAAMAAVRAGAEFVRLHAMPQW